MVIVKDDTAAKEYGLRFGGNVQYRHIYAEPTGFINKCIIRKKYEHDPEPIKGMPGRVGPRNGTGGGGRQCVAVVSPSNLLFYSLFYSDGALRLSSVDKEPESRKLQKSRTSKLLVR